MILHTLSASPSNTAFTDCLRLLTKNDALLLLGDGVYAVLINTQAYTDLMATGAELYVLDADAAAAGVLSRIGESVVKIDYDAFVNLSERFNKQTAWY